MSRQEWDKVIQSITSPLGFYVLALLIVETFLGVVYVQGADLYLKITALSIGTILFLIVIAIVTHLVIYHPQDLTFKGSDHLSKERIYGSKGREVKKDGTAGKPVVYGTGPVND